MTTLLDKKWLVIGNVQNPGEATPDQVLSRIAALAPIVERHAGEMEQARRLPAELVSALKSARISAPAPLIPHAQHGPFDIGQMRGHRGARLVGLAGEDRGADGFVIVEDMAA
jgi:hypothetical protein